MLIYIAKSTAILATLLLFYKLFLEKESVHVFKRYFLLAAVLVAIAIPTITFTTYIEAQPVFETTPVDLQINFEVVEEASKTDYLAITLWSLYGLGVLFFGIRFLVNLSKLFLKIHRNEQLKRNNFIHVLVHDLLTPHTFFKYIFFNKDKFKSNAIPKEVEIHEQAHAKQLHSIDVILIELLQVVFWFNPFVYILKNYVKLNHEFLADQAVLDTGTDLRNYQNTLLAYTYTHNQYPIANAINYSSIKKRFTIMKTKTPLKNSWLKSALLLPLVTVLIYSFSTKEVVEKLPKLQKNSLEEISPQKINENSEGATQEMMKEYNDFMKKYNSSNHKIINYDKLQRVIAIYNLMSDTQKQSVEKYPETANELKINLNKVNGKTPSISEFNSWKNAKKFAIWIDGKHTSNKNLGNYKASDIVYYNGSKVYKNVRSEKFPQPFQYNLFTEKGFEEYYKKANYNNYSKLLKVYNQQLKKVNSANYSELKILKSRLDLLFNNFSNEELNKYKPQKATDLPLSVTQTKATPKQLKEYEKLATFYSSKPWSETVVKLKDVERMKALRNLMSAEQKKNAKPFPNLPPAPKSPIIKLGVNDEDTNIPPPPVPKKGDALKIYKAKNKYYEKLRNVKPHFTKRPKKEQNRIQELFSELGSLYFSLTKENKKKANRPVHPHYPYLRLKNGDTYYYKLKSELTEEDKKNIPPPPPPPKNQKTGYKTINNEKLYYVETNGKRQYYNRYGDNVHVKEIMSGPQKGETLTITEINETPTDEVEIIEEVQEEPIEIIEVVEEEVQEQVTIDKIDKLTNEQILKLPKYQDNDVTFYLNGAKISRKKAEKLKVKNIKEIHVKRTKDTKEIHITTK